MSERKREIDLKDLFCMQQNDQLIYVLLDRDAQKLISIERGEKTRNKM